MRNNPTLGAASLSGSQRRPKNFATVGWNGRGFVVLYGGVEYARFKSVEKSNALDFTNGFNAGLARR